MNETETGALVAGRFYGQLAQMKLLVYLVILGALVNFSYLAWSYHSDPRDELTIQLLYLMSALAVMGSISTAAVIAYSGKKHPNYLGMLWSGALDWDLYENGIMTRTYSKAAANNMETRFFPFSGMSRAIMYPQRHRIDEVYKLYMDLARKKYPGQQTFGQTPGRGISMTITNGIWFVDTNGTLIDLSMQRYCLKHGAILKFKRLLREKVKVVE